MASLDYRLNPLFTIMECSSCGALYNKSCGCSKGGLIDKFVHDPNKMPDSSQRPPQDCVKCGNPVEGPSCQGCALWQKKLKEDWFTICHENGIYQDLLNTFELFDDNTNVVNAPREPFVVKQDPDRIFCQQCTYKSCRKGAHIGYNCPPKALIIYPEPCNQTIDELLQTLPSFDPTCYSEEENSLPYVSKPNFVDDSPNIFNPPPQPPIYSCEFCGNDARYGHYCTPQVPFIYPEPCYNQDFNFPQDFHDFQQQYLCCENCGGPHEAFQCQPLNYYEPNPCYDSNYSGYDQFDNSHPQQFLCCENCGGPHEIYQCQPMNEDYYHEQNSCYDPNSFGFDQFQPPQYTVNHPIFNDQNDFLNSQNKLMEQLTSIRDMVGQYIQKKEEEKRIEEEQAAKDRYWKIPVCYDDDDDEESSIPLKDIIISGLPPCVAIIPVLFTEEPVDSLIMEDEHLDTISETESDELIKPSVEDLVQIPSESEDSSEGECDLPPYDDSSKNHDLTFSNPLFDIDEDFTSSNESFSEEDVPNENFKIFYNPLFDLDEEITSTKVDQINDEFAGELTLLHLIPSGIDDVNLDPEGDILFLENLLYDNSSPRPPEEFNSKNPTESFSPSLIPVEDSDSFMEEIDIFLDGNGSIPSGIESDDFDLEDDNNSTSCPEFESFHVDYPDSGDSTIDVVEEIPLDVPNILPTHPALQLDFDFISSHNDLESNLDDSSPSGDRNKIYDPRICIEVESTKILATLSLVIDTLIPFSSENDDKVFNHGVLAYKEKSPPSSSHRGFNASKLFHQKSPMLIHGDNTPNLGVRYPHFYPPSLRTIEFRD
ncbi:hypothetical protein Tco_0706044 [Tanacetum coccineum]|uniref:Uncharacterized protein n=1 Tax=Tanacetum coccineum TaxID=301880 RepID=A0ABQ4Y8C8_9ASTR